MDGRREFGASGERLAELELARRGLRTISRNARTRWGEIDLICRDRHGYVFVEVKTRRAGAFVTAAEAATAPKIRRLVRLAWAWLAQAGERGADWRIVIAAVTVGADRTTVELIPLDRC